MLAERGRGRLLPSAWRQRRLILGAEGWATVRGGRCAAGGHRAGAFSLGLCHASLPCHGARRWGGGRSEGSCLGGQTGVLLYLCTQNTRRMALGLPRLPWRGSAGMSAPARLPRRQGRSRPMSSPAESLHLHACSSVRSRCHKKAKPQEGDGFGCLRLSSFMPAYSCLLIRISLLLHLPVIPPCRPRPLPRDT